MSWKAVLNSVIMVHGGQCVTICGVWLIPPLSADSWDTVIVVSWLALSYIVHM